MFSIGTYNILDQSYLHQGNNPSPVIQHLRQQPWGNRAQLLTNNIVNANLDLVCLQEVSQTALNDLISHLTNSPLQGKYQAVPVVNHTGKQEGVSILFDKTRFELVQQNSPQNLGSSHSTLVVDLKIKKGPQKGALIRVATTHLKGGPYPGRAEGDQHLQNLEQNLSQADVNSPVAATLLCGDFNQDQYSLQNPQLGQINRVFQHLSQWYMDGDFTGTEMQQVPYMGNDGQVHEAPKRRIDWIFYKSQAALATPITLPPPLSTIGMPVSQEIASDHCLVASRIRLMTPIAPQKSSCFKELIKKILRAVVFLFTAGKVVLFKKPPVPSQSTEYQSFMQGVNNAEFPSSNQTFAPQAALDHAIQLVEERGFNLNKPKPFWEAVYTEFVKQAHAPQELIDEMVAVLRVALENIPGIQFN